MTVYFVQRASDNAVKIGYSDQLANRLTQLRSDFRSIEVLGVVNGGRAEEKALHRRFKKYSLNGSGDKRNSTIPTDWFHPSQELMDYIAGNAKPVDVTRLQRVDVTVQMKLDATEALRILRRRYKVKGMSVALMMFIKEHDLELYEASQKRAAEFEELAGDGGDDDSA